MVISYERLQVLYKEEIQKAVACGVEIPVDRLPDKIELSKSLTQFGVCYWKWGKNDRKEDIKIKVSEYHLANSEDDVRQTIAHELCHTAPGNGHGKEWKKWAGLMNAAYGYHLSRVGTSTSGCALTDPKKPKFAHEVVCTKCGHIYGRHRNSNLTLHPERYHCGICYGTLKLKY